MQEPDNFDMKQIRVDGISAGRGYGAVVDQLAKPTFRSRYAHTPVGSAPLSVLLDSDCTFCNQVKEDVSAVRFSDWSRANDVTLHAQMTTNLTAESIHTQH